MHLYGVSDQRLHGANRFVTGSFTRQGAESSGDAILTELGLFLWFAVLGAADHQGTKEQDKKKKESTDVHLCCEETDGESV